MSDGMVTGREAAGLVGVKPGTIRQWVARGHLQVAGRVRTRNLYRVADVLAAEKRTREANPSCAMRQP